MEKQNSNLSNGNKVKLLCSYGGRIWSRPTDHQLSYIGGETKILAVDRSVRFSEIAAKLNSICNRENFEISIKYQLPGEDLDSLVSLIDDDDVEHMMVEYDRLQRISSKPVRLRLFIFDISPPPIRPVKPDAKELVPVTHSNPDYLFGFDKEYQPSISPPLDLLQIPGMILQENYGLIPCGAVEGNKGVTECHLGNRGSDAAENGAAPPQAVYHVPAVVSGGVYQAGHYTYSVVPAMATGSGEQPLYSLVPVLPSARRPGF